MREALREQNSPQRPRGLGTSQELRTHLQRLSEGYTKALHENLPYSNIAIEQQPTLNS